MCACRTRWWRTFRTLVTYGFYPVALALTLLFIDLEVSGALGPLGKAYPAYLELIILSMLFLEWVMPLKREWSITWSTFLKRDLPMLLLNGAAIGATNAALAGWLLHAQITTSRNWPWWLECIAIILMADFLWYWVHRTSHESRGRLGRWLWSTHVHHHLPEQVYVFMHVVGHPLNGVYVRVILMLPALAFGFSKEAVFAAAVLNGFQGLVSHFNVDIRAGWFNRVFMGTELHRYHHSTDPAQAKNFAAVVTVWDQLFGTYALQKGVVPVALGVNDRARYPADDQWLALMAWPFRR